VFIPAGLPEAFFSLLSSLLEVALAER
jgi:hypothetical protein